MTNSEITSNFRNLISISPLKFGLRTAGIRSPEISGHEDRGQRITLLTSGLLVGH
jgi:hypothetical protein